MSIFNKNKNITLNELSYDSLTDLKNKIEDELKKRNEDRQGTLENIAKQIRELLELKENRNKYLVFNMDGYFKVISVADTDVDYNCCGNPSYSSIIFHSHKGGVEYGTIGDIWVRLNDNHYPNKIYISLFDTTNAIEVVKNSLKTKEEVLEILQNHLTKCGEKFVKHYFDRARTILNLK